MGFEIIETIVAERPAENASEFMVPTRDGVQLATDVYLPDRPGSHGAILVRTPYDKSSFYTALKFEAEYFCSRGYAFVAQDVRGKYGSTGATMPYAFDVADGYDTVEWIVQQPWSNGKVGVMGASYYGFTTWAAVASGHPAIRAAIPMVTGIEMGDGHVGARWRHDIQSFASFNDLLQIWSNNDCYLADVNWEDETVAEILADARRRVGPCIGADQKLARSQDQGWYNPYGDRHPYYTTQIPILHWQNWYDPGLAPAGMRDWRHFQTIPGSRNLHFLRVGSADHGGYKLSDVGRGDEANPYLDAGALRRRIQEECAEQADFFDEHLGDVVPSSPRPRARWHVGHVGWQETDAYPPSGTIKTFHLAVGENGVHELADRATDESRELGWLHDPASPVPSSVDMEAIWYFCAAYPDERAYAGRSDVLTFRTAPLAEDLDVAGQPVLKARIDFSGPSTHVHLRLHDVYPDGVARPISQARVALGRTSRDRIVVPLDDNAYRFKRGHALQLLVMSSDSPHYVVHPGTDENPFLATTRKATEQRLHVGGDGGAVLELLQIKVQDRSAGC
ncbi:MAG: CocE/NonD family hydrolase [Nocardioides sp.]|uniref:CocE/NonD family hydrolase n=1 Tax=Nocardioides sp. TaxID=35761 RepID=UPI0039E363C8